MKTFKDVVKTSVYIKEATPFSEYPYFACTCEEIKKERRQLAVSVYWDPVSRSVYAMLGEERKAVLRIPDNAYRGMEITGLSVVRRFE